MRVWSLTKSGAIVGARSQFYLSLAVKEDGCGSVREDHGFEDLAGMNDSLIEGTHGDDMQGGESVAGVQEQNAEGLPI